MTLSLSLMDPSTNGRRFSENRKVRSRRRHQIHFPRMLRNVIPQVRATLIPAIATLKNPLASGSNYNLLAFVSPRLSTIEDFVRSRARSTASLHHIHAFLPRWISLRSLHPRDAIASNSNIIVHRVFASNARITPA